MPYLVEIAPGIHQIYIEAVREGAVSSVFLVEGERAALVETGPAILAPHVLEAVDKWRCGRRGIAYIIPTHLHMDHGGGVGALARELPQALVAAHYRFAHHVVDPVRLIAGTVQVWGENYAKEWGPILPVPPERVLPVKDGERLDLGGRELEVVFTPGHAPHHVSVWEPGTRTVFCGETLGSYLKSIRVVVPTVAVPFFDLEQALSSMDRVIALDPELLVFSQGGPCHRVKEAGRQAREVILATAEQVREAMEQGLGEHDIVAGLKRFHEAHLTPFLLSAGDGFNLEEELWLDYYEQMATGLMAFFRRQDLRQD
ncbi:MAG: MBL fold metallo-hydrolase [Dehalococcoidia bacterium]|nr:MBL fold metallo-hydrolase [Dehalococcoidia bacterium]